MTTIPNTISLKLLIAVFVFIGGLMANAETLSLQLKGKAELLKLDEVSELYDLLGLESAPADVRNALLDINTYCYRAPLRDSESGLRVGTGYHCVAQIVHDCPPMFSELSKANVLDTINNDSAANVDPNIVKECPDVHFVEFVVFRLIDGILVARTHTTVQKNLTGNTDDITHITGFFPSGDNIVFGTGKFRGIDGKIRLSGGVNLDSFPEVVGFDSLFQVDVK